MKPTVLKIVSTDPVIKTEAETEDEQTLKVISEANYITSRRSKVFM
jgi:hypothetical protein